MTLRVALFSVQRGALYTLPIEPLLHQLKEQRSDFVILGCMSRYIVSAYLDDAIIFIQRQNDINSH